MSSSNECTIIVLGDLGRSPRMRNHAVELLGQKFKVNLLGYLDNALNDSFLSNKQLNVVDLNLKIVHKLRLLPRKLYLIYALLRIMIETFYLLYVLLFKLGRQEFILIQNPPSIPVMAVCYFVKLIKRTLFVIDFHNYGYTILELQIKNKYVVNLAKYYERFFGRRADFSFCVSKAMQQDLILNWQVSGVYNNQNYPVVLYDKANLNDFKPFVNLTERHLFLRELGLCFDGVLVPDESVISIKSGGKIILKEDRPILMISSTSWTKDEDFGILLTALEAYELHAKSVEKSKKQPKLFVLITGKGPEKEYYQNIITQRKRSWQYIKIELLWLQPQDYPKLLAACDIGVCLHYSSSGLDLPMKVVDMFGAGIPVLAKKYKAIPELVEHHQNGILFDHSQDLFEYILMLFKNFPHETKDLDDMREKVKPFRQSSFHDEWITKVLPMIRRKNTNKIQ